MTITDAEAQWFAGTFDTLRSTIGQAVLGQEAVIDQVLTCLFAQGHVLVEDTPGTGKTSMARAISAAIQGRHQRIQFTPDLLPSDVTGVTIYDQATREFSFHPGPIFANVVLADEINRASPKTQSALLEVMEEGRVTVDGTRYDVAAPFMVIATQNPVEQAGTYRLPEAQLDRFLMKIAMRSASIETLVEIFAGSSAPDRAATITPVITGALVIDMAAKAHGVYVDPGILDYVARLVTSTASHPKVRMGVSIRGGLALVRTCKVWALSKGRSYVIPDDVKDLVGPVWAHRIILDPEAEFAGMTAQDVIGAIVLESAPPQGALVTA